MSAILSWPRCVIRHRLLTVLMLKLEYSGRIRSIPWLLMPCLHELPGHQHPWHWPCRIKWSMPSTRNNLTHWDWVTYICISKLTIIGSDNGLSPGQRQPIIWTNAGILFIKPLKSNFGEILIEIHTFSLSKMHLKMLSANLLPFCLGLNVLRNDRKSKHILCFQK